MTIERTEARFNPGKVVATAALLSEFREAIPETFEAELTSFLGMHLRGDWGDVDGEDWAHCPTCICVERAEGEA